MHSELLLDVLIYTCRPSFWFLKKPSWPVVFFSEGGKLIKIKMDSNKSVNFVTFSKAVFKRNRWYSREVFMSFIDYISRQGKVVV
jgi:hypothetical protein